MYQATTRNADTSAHIFCEQDILEFRANHRNERRNVPNAVPIEFGTNLNWRFTTVAHKLRASTGNGGMVKTVGSLVRDAASDMAILANARVPKYARRILLLEVIA